MTRTSGKFLPAIRLTAACLILSFLLNGDCLFRHFSLVQLQPSFDIWLLLSALALANVFGRRVFRFALVSGWLLFLTLRLIRIGDTIVPVYFNRRFNLYLDSAYLTSLYDLLKTSSDTRDALVLAVMAAGTGLCFLVLSWLAWSAAARSLADKGIRNFFLCGTLIVCTGAFAGGYHPPETPAIIRLGQEIRSSHRQQEQQQTIREHMVEAARKRQKDPFLLKKLRGADVLLFMVESYGQIVYSSPRFKKDMATTMTGLAETLTQHGYGAVSSFLVSPTFGGGSYLAQSTLEFGVKVANRLEYNTVLRSSLIPFNVYFHNSGYRTVSVMPGTRLVYPEGSFYRYDQAYYAWNFDYRGPSFGWAPMADQFVLNWVNRQELSGPRSRPLFIRFVLISSHASFSMQPPYIKDWNTIGDGSIYNRLPIVRYPVVWPSLKNAEKPYLRSLAYDFKILGDFLTKYVKGGGLIVVMGDHQPNGQLTGNGQPWSVPVHIISRDPELLAPFRRRGYTEGLIPLPSLHPDGMETFSLNFLKDFQ